MIPITINDAPNVYYYFTELSEEDSLKNANKNKNKYKIVKSTFFVSNELTNSKTICYIYKTNYNKIVFCTNISRLIRRAILNSINCFYYKTKLFLY